MALEPGRKLWLNAREDVSWKCPSPLLFDGTAAVRQVPRLPFTANARETGRCSAGPLPATVVAMRW